jgi:hypothetical protein
MPLNFYELYNLLNENTISQELKNLKKNIPRLSEDIIEAKKELKAAFLHLDIADKSLEALAKWMVLIFLKPALAKSNQDINYLWSAMHQAALSKRYNIDFTTWYSVPVSHLKVKT